VRRELTRGERPGGEGVTLSAALGETAADARRALEAALQIGELALARGDGLGALAQRPLQELELGVALRLGRLPALRELAGEPQQLGAVEVGPRLLTAVWPARSPFVEAFFPAIHACPQCA
jgi:hypothetical protein